MYGKTVNGRKKRRRMYAIAVLLQRMSRLVEK
jgi:hypothetical protein